MNYKITEIASLIGGKFINPEIYENDISNVIYDSRKISFPKNSIFIALTGNRVDGHDFIKSAYAKGIRNFLTSKPIDLSDYKNSNFISINDTLKSLQLLAQKHRAQYKYPVLAITGSNGKTTVKEWLSKALSKKYKIVKSPKSFNSQLGVALSVLQMDKKHDFAIIEAGISTAGEMQNLQRMIQANYGILTNIGDAHSAGFISKNEKLKEKIILFKTCSQVIFNADDKLITTAISDQITGIKCSWGTAEKNKIRVASIKKESTYSYIKLHYKGAKYNFNIPFQTTDLIENAMHVITFLLLDGFDEETIQQELNEINPIANRLEIKEGIYNSLLINDTYSSDLASMQMAMEYQDLHHADKGKILIFSDFDQQLDKEKIFLQLNELLIEKKIETAIGIGIEDTYKKIFSTNSTAFYDSAGQFLKDYNSIKIKDKCVLIKGARKFKLEVIYAHLSKQIHETILETDFSAMANNLNYYKSKLNEKTKVMAVVKAEAYGSGSIQVAQFLEHQKIDYLAVALVDEAIKIRNEGCSLPLMIFNTGSSSVETLLKYNLEPEVYSFELLHSITRAAERLNAVINIHLKIDTGMNRLGFKLEEISELNSILKKCNLVKVKSIFSHLAASENSDFDDFTLSQFKQFDNAYSQVCDAICDKPIKHILNTAGTIRFPEYQYDMVRIGLGLYGIDETGLSEAHLEKVHTLKSSIIQIKSLKKGETTGYSRSGKAEQDMRIAIVNIGYADGLMRGAGNGNYHPLVNDQACKIVGNICMDVCMVDITGYSNVNVGDTVEFFGKSLDIKELATACNTISYEIISRIAPRIKRLYTYN